MVRWCSSSPNMALSLLNSPFGWPIFLCVAVAGRPKLQTNSIRWIHMAPNQSNGTRWKLWQMQWSVCIARPTRQLCSVSKCDPKSFWIWVRARHIETWWLIAHHVLVAVCSMRCQYWHRRLRRTSERTKRTRKVNQLKCIRLNADCHWIYCVLKCSTGWHFPWKYHCWHSQHSHEMKCVPEPKCSRITFYVLCARNRSTIECQYACARWRQHQRDGDGWLEGNGENQKYIYRNEFKSWWVHHVARSGHQHSYIRTISMWTSRSRSLSLVLSWMLCASNTNILVSFPFVSFIIIVWRIELTKIWREFDERFSISVLKFIVSSAAACCDFMFCHPFDQSRSCDERTRPMTYTHANMFSLRSAPMWECDHHFYVLYGFLNNMEYWFLGKWQLLRCQIGRRHGKIVGPSRAPLTIDKQILVDFIICHWASF